MGLLTADVTQFGIVMTTDSQPIELVDGGLSIVTGSGPLTKERILSRRGGGLAGLVGYVGTESIGGAVGGADTRVWLEQFDRENPDLTLEEFCRTLADALSQEWATHRLDTCLWIFVAGCVDRDPRFWYIVNCERLDEQTGSYTGVGRSFRAVNDLDENYVPQHLGTHGSKAGVLRHVIFSFRNGALMPAAPIFDGFTRIMEFVYRGGYPGFDPVSSLDDDYAYLARQRMEFTKRLFSKKHGIYRDSPALIAGDIHVGSAALDGSLWSYGKHRSQVNPRP